MLDLVALLMSATISTETLVATAPRNKGIIELHHPAGPCLGEARLAIYKDKNEYYPGCWLIRINVVTVAFLNGEYIAIPISQWRALPEKVKINQ